MRLLEALVTVVMMLMAPHDAVAAAARTATLGASHDATLIEDPNGALANGSGPAFFVGRTNQARGSIRRAALLFDVAGALPRQALVEAVEVELQMLPSNPEPRAILLHRLLSAWGEGASSSSGGSGAPAAPGDVTWLHTFFDTEYWVEPGGQFIGRPSARMIVEDPGAYVWGSTDHMVQDVRLWNQAPDQNFGWILVGDETAGQTAKNFASRESSDPALRPVLRITYRLPGDEPAP